MKKILLLLFIMSSIMQAQVPTDWQVDGLKGKVKLVTISYGTYSQLESDSLFRMPPRGEFQMRGYDELGYLVSVVNFDVYDGRGLVAKGSTSYEKYEGTIRSIVGNYWFQKGTYRGKQEWSSPTAYATILYNETLDYSKIIIEAKCDEEGHLLQSVETYYGTCHKCRTSKSSEIEEVNEYKITHLIEPDYSSLIEKNIGERVELIKEDKCGNPEVVRFYKGDTRKRYVSYVYEYYE